MKNIGKSSIMAWLSLLLLTICVQAAPSPKDDDHAQMRAMVRSILKYSAMMGGVEENFQLERVEDVDNAYAYVKDGKRWLAYDPAFLKNMANEKGHDWTRLGVLAHEIGHHVNGHTLDGRGSTHEKEKQADYYAGYVLGLMGASKEQAQAFLSNRYISDGGVTHPPKKERLECCGNGWQTAQNIVVRRTRQDGQNQNLIQSAREASARKLMYVHTKLS